MGAPAARRWALALGLLLAPGCSLVAAPPPVPTYAAEELRATCERTGGWWRGDLIAGFCEYQAPGFL